MENKKTIEVSEELYLKLLEIRGGIKQQHQAFSILSPEDQEFNSNHLELEFEPTLEGSIEYLFKIQDLFFDACDQIVDMNEEISNSICEKCLREEYDNRERD